MKKVTCLILSFILLLGMLGNHVTIYAENVETTFFEGLEYDPIQNTVTLTDNVIESYDNTSMLNSFINNGGILVIKHTNNSMHQLDLQIGSSFYVSSAESDLATMYYKYGNNLTGKYIITRGTEENVDLDALIDEAVEEIKQRQTDTLTMSISQTQGSISLGIVEVVTTAPPKGKLRSRYEIFTIQDYHDRDYYIVKAFHSGIPGCVLAQEDASYTSSYKIKNLESTISTPTESVSISAYGPYSTEKADSYTVDLGITADMQGNLQISSGFSYTKTIYHTDITTSATSKTVNWDVDINKSARETTFTFEPGVTFVCPSNKSEISINIYASCVLDSWYSFSETIELSRTIVCTPTNLYDY